MAKAKIKFADGKEYTLEARGREMEDIFNLTTSKGWPKRRADPAPAN